MIFTGTRDIKATSPRVCENPRTQAIEDNQSSCLQKFLDLEPSKATSPRVYNRSFHLNQRVKPFLGHPNAGQTDGGQADQNPTRCSVQGPTRCSRAQTDAPATDQPTVDNVARSLTSAQKLQLSWRVKQQQDARHQLSDRPRHLKT